MSVPLPQGARRCRQCGAGLAADHQALTCSPCSRRDSTAAVPSPPELPLEFWESSSLGAALATRDQDTRIELTSLLAPASWLPVQPVPLENVALRWDVEPVDAILDGAAPEGQASRPLRLPGQRFDRYTLAVRYLDSPTLFENRPSYLWRNIVRELNEELLGAPEFDGSSSQQLNYERWPLFRSLQRGRETGRIKVYCFGVACDALTLAATIPSVLVIDDEIFDELFGGIAPQNAEGITVTGLDGQPAATGIPFSQQNITQFLKNEPMAPPGAACLALAWKHRGLLLSR